MNKKMLLALLLAWSQWACADNLLQVYDMALHRDPVLKEAAAVRESRYEAKPLARSSLLPQVSLSGDINYNYQDIDPVGSDYYSNGRVGVGVTQPIYRRDRLIRVEQAEWQLDLADADYLTQQQDLMLRVATAYFNVLSAKENLGFVRADKKAIARQLEQAKQRFEVGLIAITGVHEAQARYDQARADEILAQNELDNAWEDLRLIIGVKLDQLADLQKDIELRPPQPAVIDEWSSMALVNSPLVKAASDATQIAQREIEVQRSGNYPTLDLVGNYTSASADLSNGLDSDQASIGLQLNMPLYTGGAVSASTRQARADLVAAQERLDQVRRKVDQEVRNAYRGVQASISAVRALEAAIVSTKSALDATTAGFEVGTRTLVDVLNSQRDYYRSQSNYAKARYVYVINMLRLKRAAGTLSKQDLQTLNAHLEG